MKIKLFILLFVFGFSYTQKTVTYRVLEDTPELTPTTVINLDFFQLDMNLKSLEAMSFNLGVWGYHDIMKDALAIDFSIRKSFLTAARLGNPFPATHWEVNLGADYFLQYLTKRKNLKVTLKNEYKGSTYDFSEGTRTDHYLETSIKVPGKVSLKRGIRAGFYYKTNPYEFRDKTDNFTLSGGKMTSAGIYAGIMLRKSINLYIKTNKYGVKYTSWGQEWYLDALVLPYVRFMDNYFTETAELVDYTNIVKNDLKAAPIGFRLGWKAYQIAGKPKTGKKFGLAAGFEVGAKPYLGFFMNGSIGITLVKSGIKSK